MYAYVFVITFGSSKWSLVSVGGCLKHNSQAWYVSDISQGLDDRSAGMHKFGYQIIRYLHRVCIRLLVCTLFIVILILGYKAFNWDITPTTPTHKYLSVMKSFMAPGQPCHYSFVVPYHIHVQPVRHQYRP